MIYYVRIQRINKCFPDLLILSPNNEQGQNSRESQMLNPTLIWETTPKPLICAGLILFKWRQKKERNWKMGPVWTPAGTKGM